MSNLIDTALKQNLGVREAAVRVEAARSAATGAGEMRPELVGGTRLRRDTSTERSSDSMTPTKFGKLATFAGGSLEASWELDLFGRGTAERRIADLNVQDLQEQVRAARTVVVCDVFKWYAAGRLAAQERAVLERAIEARRALLKAVHHQSQSGFASDFDVARVETELNNLLARVPTVDAQMQESAAAIGALLGSPEPTAIATSASPIPLERFDFRSVPAALLLNRPDVRAAADAVQRAAAERDIANADLYPRLMIKGDLAIAPSFTSGIPTNLASGIGPSLSIPLFDHDLRVARLSSREQLIAASVHAYRDKVVHAAAEARRALAVLRSKEAQEANLRKAISSAKVADDRSDRLYQGGMIGLTDRLTATLTVTELELLLLNAEAEHVLAVSAFFKAIALI